MYRTREATHPDMVVVIDSAAAKGEVCEVIMYGVAKPIPFHVVVHRDVVIGEILELDR